MANLKGTKVVNFAELSDYCVHYCDVGGHLWLHKIKNETGKCAWKTPDGKHKFFSLCPDHRPHRADLDEDWL